MGLLVPSHGFNESAEIRLRSSQPGQQFVGGPPRVPLTFAQAQRLRLLTPHEVAGQMHADRAARPTSNLVLNFRVVDRQVANGAGLVAAPPVEDLQSIGNSVPLLRRVRTVSRSGSSDSGVVLNRRPRRAIEWRDASRTARLARQSVGDRVNSSSTAATIAPKPTRTSVSRASRHSRARAQGAGCLPTPSHPSEGDEPPSSGCPFGFNRRSNLTAAD